MHIGQDKAYGVCLIRWYEYRSIFINLNKQTLEEISFVNFIDIEPKCL